MSRAFTKERDDAPEPVIDSHIPGLAVPVTARGQRELQAQLERTQSATERKRLEALVPDLAVVEPPEDRAVVAFGATVDVHAEPIGARRFTVVGPEEVDVAAGRISDASPLGAALVGAHIGDRVRWQRPAGDIVLTIDAIAYDDPAAGT